MDEAPPHGGGGITVWGAISNTGRSQLVQVQGNLTAAQYIQDILQPHVLPLMGTPGAVFQQDNARPHTARITVAYFNNQNIRTLPWPSLSPDLSPIEHLWDELDRRLRVRNVPPATPDELFAVLQKDWETIPRQTIQHLIASMPRRCRAVIQANGGHTQYCFSVLTMECLQNQRGQNLDSLIGPTPYCLDIITDYFLTVLIL